MHAADVHHEEHHARALGADGFGRDDLVVDRVQPAREAGEHRRDREHDEAHALRVIADEFRALRIVAHRVAHAPDRRAQEVVHRRRRHEEPEGDHVIDLELRAEIEPEPMGRAGAARGDAFLTAEKSRQHQRRRVDHLAHAQRDESEDGSSAPCRERAEHDPEGEPRRGARERHQRDRDREARVHRAQEVDRGVAAEPEVDGVAEGQQPRLSEQQVVREGENRGDPHLAQERAAEARVEAGNERQHRQQRGRGDPPRRPRAFHASRVPRRPRGRTISIATSSRYGMIGAACAILIARISRNGISRVTVTPSAPRRSSAE